MRKILFSIILTTIFACEKADQNLIEGTYFLCQKNGSYREFLFLENYLLMLDSEFDEIWIYNIKYKDSTFYIDKPSNSEAILTFDKKFSFKKLNNKKIILKNLITEQIIELNKAESNLRKIDSLNFKYWRESTIKDFKIRAKNKKCKKNNKQSETTFSVNTDSLLKSYNEETIILD